MKPVGKVLGVVLTCGSLWAAQEYFNFANSNKTHNFVISFSTGTMVNNPETLKEAFEVLYSNPNYDFVVHGHTATIGNVAANERLSRERAKFVYEELLGISEKIVEIPNDVAIDSSRGKFEYHGGADPLPREDQERDRIYQSRLGRAEIEIYFGGFDNEQN